ncbi:MAG: hypothetical protein ACI9ZT_000470 [Gammaproteobacteria bacterium]
MHILTEFRNVIIIFFGTFGSFVCAQDFVYVNPLKLPEPNIIEEARQIVATMINAERGPYRRLRWFCADGTTHEPQAYACSERGGGKQHAEYSEEREHLAELGWHVGTIYASEDLSYWTDSGQRQERLRELALEKYLLDIDDGWILNKAKFSRGRVQAEDEEYAGRQLLLSLLDSPQWIGDNYLLLRELVRVIPHSGAGTDLNRVVRRLALEIAQLNPDFELLRIEVHTTPSIKTIRRIEDWVSRSAEAPELGKVHTLLSRMNDLYGEAGRQTRLARLHEAIANIPKIYAIQTLVTAPATETAIDRAKRLGQLLQNIREAVITDLKPGQRLQLLDGINDIEAELRISANRFLENEAASRRELLSIIQGLLMASYGSGLLTKGEHAEVMKNLQQVTASTSTAFGDYQNLSETLNLTASWAIGSIRYTFAEALNRYTALDSRSAGFIDDVLRSSPMLQLAELSRQVVQDVQLLSGVSKTIGAEPATSLLSLNPGIAVGPLRIISDDDLRNNHAMRREEIVVLPQTVSELTPVAGVMTLGEGNPLSHVQLLARNFGIPNISITPELMEKIRLLNGRQVALIAASDGSVVLEEFDHLSAAVKLLLAPANNVMEKMDVPLPNLEVRQPIPLAELNKGLSGILVGPKAANLGELNRLFPGTVASAIALPFGFFLDNVNRNETSNWNQLASIYDAYRNATLDEEKLREALTELRTAVSRVTVEENYREKLTSLMQQLFGEDGSYGVFLRSDTNVEDLPGFTGAGLSETVANVVGFENQMNTIPTIWASVLSARAIAWRSNLLKQPERVYPSVLLMKSVPSEKSGVLITADLFGRSRGITTSTAWGVGGAVAGETAESLLLLEDGSEVLISEAKTPYQRFLPERGGVAWLPAADGSVLSLSEKNQLRVLSRVVQEKSPPLRDANGKILPWDIEFGFVNEELKLFQIRPLVQRGQEKANHIISTIHPVRISIPEFVNLDSPALTVSKTVH